MYQPRSLHTLSIAYRQANVSVLTFVNYSLGYFDQTRAIVRYRYTCPPSPVPVQTLRCSSNIPKDSIRFYLCVCLFTPCLDVFVYLSPRLTLSFTNLFLLYSSLFSNSINSNFFSHIYIKWLSNILCFVGLIPWVNIIMVECYITFLLYCYLSICRPVTSYIICLFTHLCAQTIVNSQW